MFYTVILGLLGPEPWMGQCLLLEGDTADTPEYLLFTRLISPNIEYRFLLDRELPKPNLAKHSTFNFSNNYLFKQVKERITAFQSHREIANYEKTSVLQQWLRKCPCSCGPKLRVKETTAYQRCSTNDASRQVLTEPTARECHVPTCLYGQSRTLEWAGLLCLEVCTLNSETEW